MIWSPIAEMENNEMDNSYIVLLKLIVICPYWS